MNTFELPSPFVALAAPIDGLLPVSALDKPLPVNIVIWENMQTGYFVQLTLNDQLLGEPYAKTDADLAGDIMTLKLPVGNLEHEGLYRLGYRATNDKSLHSTDAPAIQIRVDRSVPGATLLAPLIFANINFDVLKAQVPCYAGMAVGDTLQTLCNGVQGPSHTISDDDLNRRPMQISFTRDFLQSLDNTQVEFSYQITDRAGNQSLLAWPVTLTMSA